MSASRGATPRGIGRSSLATSSPSSASIEGRRNPRRYTTEDIDREIAAYKEESDSDEDDEKDDGDDDDIGKKKKKRTKKPPAVARGGGKRKVGSSSEEEHNDDTNGTEDDESDDSTDFGVSSSTMKKKSAMTTQQKRGAPKKKKQVWNDSENSDNDDDDDEEDDDNDSDSSSDFGGKKKKKTTMTTPSKSKTAPSAGRKGGGRSPTTEMIKTPTPRKQPRTATIRGASARRRDKSINDDNDDNEEDIVYDTTPSGSRRPRRQCKTETLQRMSDTVAKLKQSEREALGDMLEDDDKELLFGGSSNNDDDDEDDDVNDDEVVSQKKKRERAIVTANGRGCNVVTSPSRTGRKKLHEDDDDEDYNYGDSSSNPSDDSDNNASDDNDDDDDDDIVPKQRRHRATAKKSPSYLESDEEIGTADEDSDDEDTAPAVLTSPTQKASNGFGRSSGSPNARARARMGRTPLEIHESRQHKFSNESSDDDSSNNDNKRSRTRKIKPTCITCSSTTDNITMANLPRDKPHVCYIAPDGKTRHCYTLDTLYRIAISSKDNGSSTSNNTNLSLLGDVRSQTSSLQFLQPPHFRLPMEDDLLDQIASRFGRAALLIESSIMYKRLKGSTTGELDDFDEDGEYIGGSSYASRGGGSSSSSSITRLSFHERFEKYMQSLMGSADVYCCPLCFNEADRRLGIVDDELLEDDDTHNNDDDDDDNVTKDRFSFMDDPLTILGSLDSDEFISASSFCFRYLTGVKAHMNTMHGVNVKDIVGNDLFKRFQIRAPDGLLQNWIKRSLGHRNISVQGDMMRYWLGGGNQSFILLLNQIDKGDARGDVRSDFSLSFPNRAKKIWRDVSAPYLKQHDLGDFIAEEGDDDDESEGDVAADLHVNPNFTPSSIDKRGGASFKSPEEQLISHLQKRNSMKKKTFDSSDDDSSNTNNDNDGEDEDEDDDELEILPKPPQYEDIEEEEMDEWTQSKLLKAKKAKQGSQESKDTGDDDDDDDDDDDVELFDSNIETDNTTNVNGSAICKRLIIDDEDTNSVPDSGLMAQPEISIGSSRKRTIAESSDDEESF